jgi:hypothetical protein
VYHHLYSLSRGMFQIKAGGPSILMATHTHTKVVAVSVVQGVEEAGAGGWERGAKGVQGGRRSAGGCWS